MKRILFALFAAMTAVMSYAQTEIKVEVHRVVEVGEQFNVTFIIEGEGNVTDFSWTPSDDLQLLWGPQSGRSSSVQIVNGKMTKSVQNTYTYILRAMSKGQCVLPSATARLKKDQIMSSPVTIEVVERSSSSASVPGQSAQPKGQQPQRQGTGVGTGDIFLDLTLSRDDVVVGEPIIATLKLYQRVNIAGFEGVSFPTFNGFWSQELEAPSNIEFARETYDGQIYNAALLRKFVLIPQRTGTITINPAELVCLVSIRVSSGGTSIFDGFFDDYRTVRQKVASKPLDVNVRALPSGAPSSFRGGVGQFSMSARLSKDTLKTHEAGSLIVTVSGTGNVSLLEAPKVNFPPDMEVYDIKVSDRVDKGGLSGSKTYEFPFIPRSHGDFVIEPIKYTYYDINAKKYVTLQTSPLDLVVEKGKELESSHMVAPTVRGKDVRNLGSDIRYISVKTPKFSVKGRFFVGSVAFWVAVVLVLGLGLVLWLIFRKLAARRADVAGTKNRKATKMAMRRLSLAGTFLKQNLYSAFYEELHKALLGFISDKMNMPVSDLSRDGISQGLEDRGVDRSLVQNFIDILDACEFARYSPSSGSEAMAAHYNSAIDVISSIDSDMKTTRKDRTSVYAVMALMLLVSSPAFAGQDAYVDSLWNSSNEAYAQGRWEDALSGYEMISGMGLESAALYCNMGDAFYKSGNIPMAILNYELALKADPSYADAQYNLQLVQGLIQDRIDPVPEFVLSVWVRKVCMAMGSDSWAVLFILLLALAVAMVLLFVLSSSVAGRRTGFFTGVVLVLLASFSLAFSLWQKNEYMKTEGAIVVRPVSAVKSSPSSESSQDLFVLHEGTKVKVMDQVGDWNNIELADGRQGWIPSKDIVFIK